MATLRGKGKGGNRVAVAMALVAPALLSRASAADADDIGAVPPVFRETGARLLELASVDQAAFRGVVAGMSEGQRAFMEEVIRSGRRAGGAAGGDGGEGGEEEVRPSIALKMDFGG